MSQKVQFLLEDIKNKNIVLPEFQREYTWKRDQVKDFFDSLLKKYPVGSLLIWKTNSPPALKNLPEFDPEGLVKVLLDGQQRLTAFYLLMKNEIPPYYKKISSKRDPRNLNFNLEKREFKYYKASEMKNEPRWVPVRDCFQEEIDVGEIAEEIEDEEEGKFDLYKKLNNNLEDLRDLLNHEFPIMQVEENSGLEDALVVFDRVNTGGTSLSDADVALAYMCSHWENTRREFKKKIGELKEEGFEFDLKFMIRSMNAVINRRAYYHLMHDVEEDELKKGWEQLQSILDYMLNLLKDRAYIYSTDDLNTPNILIPLIGYIAEQGGEIQSDSNLKMMLYWMYAALYKRRYSGSADQRLQEDLQAIENKNPIQKLLQVLKEEVGSLKVTVDDLEGRGVGHPLYNMMCFVIRANSGVDWSNGLNLSDPIGDKFEVERHHIFPRKVLKEAGHDTGDNQHHYNLVHEIANRAPLTRSANRSIFRSKPAEYLPKVKDKNPGNLEKFFIPSNEKLWRVKNYEIFLKRRRRKIVEGINQFMNSLRDDSRIEKLPLEELLEEEESKKLEFKARLKAGTEEGNYRLEYAVLKTITGMLNAEGGGLLIGVNDDGEPVGIEKDFELLGKSNRDGFELNLTDLIEGRIGGDILPLIDFRYEKVDDKTVCIIDIDRSPKAVYLKTDEGSKFYARMQNSTRELQGNEADEYKNRRF